MITNFKNRLVDWLRHPYIGAAIGMIYGDRVPAYGFRIATDDPLISAQVKANLFWGVYENSEVRLARRYLRHNLDVIELGSSLGVVSCQIRAWIDPDRTLYCIEANPQLIPLLQKNLAINRLDQQAVVLQYAIDYQAAEVQLVVGNNHTASKVDHQAVGRNTVAVPAVTLKKLLAMYPIGDYALVADIEGSEAGIFQNDGEALRRCQQMIIELHNTPDLSRQQMLDLLTQQHGFTLLDQHGHVYALERR